MKFLLSVLLFLMTLGAYSQSVNDYQYVVIPEKYEEMKKPDQHQVNSLTKFLLNKYGFDAYLATDDKPFLMADASCDILYADLINNSNFIQTRLALALKDCDGNVVYETSPGSSKIKEYRAAYQTALRAAMGEIEALKYSYTGVKKTKVDNPVKKEITQPKIVEQPKESATAVVPTPETKAVKEAVVKQVETVAVQKPLPEVVKDVNVQVDNTAPATYTSTDGFYKAIQLENSITFYENGKDLGSAAVLKEGFHVATTEFEGDAYFKEDTLVIERKIKGVAGVVQMIFTQQ